MGAYVLGGSVGWRKWECGGDFGGFTLEESQRERDKIDKCKIDNRHRVGAFGRAVAEAGLDRHRLGAGHESVSVFARSNRVSRFRKQTRPELARGIHHLEPMGRTQLPSGGGERLHAGSPASGLSVVPVADSRAQLCDAGLSHGSFGDRDRGINRGRGFVATVGGSRFSKCRRTTRGLVLSHFPNVLCSSRRLYREFVPRARVCVFAFGANGTLAGSRSAGGVCGDDARERARLASSLMRGSRATVAPATPLALAMALGPRCSARVLRLSRDQSTSRRKRIRFHGNSAKSFSHPTGLAVAGHPTSHRRSASTTKPG